MSQRILRALMQLFALIVSPIGQNKGRKKIVKLFLLEQLNKEQVDEYIKIYQKYVEQYQKRQSKSSPNKILSVSSVKLLTICSLLNEELIQQQKIVVLIKLLEFIRIDENISEQTYEFITTVADSFKIPQEELDIIKNFILRRNHEFIEPNRVLVVNSTKKDPEKINHLYIDGLKGEIYVLYIKIQNILVFYFEGDKEVYLNQQLLQPYRIYVLSYGAALRTHTIRPIYYNDIINVFNADKNKSKIVFEADKVFYKFKNNKIGIHPVDLTERSGRLVGIMGGSGSGKTTLLNILNGNFEPTSGHIFINGINLNKNKQELNGLIGYVSQDDLLIEELTVFENLFFNAKLCFGDTSEFTIKRKVIKNLKELGLYDIKDMKVGSIMNRKISGGQRKRLNIALELVREPPILFLDEPTSGLSSRDSENIMDLLKDLTLKGKLVFVVIHQPSSAIFKMFDRLVVLDQGGYLIYNGKPIEAILFFKSAVREADWNDTVCPVCGNINPEQIFNIIETRVLDEYGNQTQTRKFPPEDWYHRFKKYQEKYGRKKSYLVRKLPKIPFNVPSKFKQFQVFVKRDLLSKFSNPQYLLVNLLETPLMALILSYIIKFFPFTSERDYRLFYNENLPVYIFMSVIIAIFVGLTVSAQEIHRDRKILKREAFLNLSRFSYLTSKTFNMFLISAYQSFIFVLIGNKIIEVSFFNFEYWIVLFSVWFSSNILGLIISEAFKSSATIYIIIPFLVIPQIILSGVLVPYNKLNPSISKPHTIPWYGEIMTARWGYEALVVKQFKDNLYMRNFFDYNKEINYYLYIKDYWCVELKKAVDNLIRDIDEPEKKQECLDDLLLIRNELNDHKSWLVFPITFNVENLTYDKVSKKQLNALSQYLSETKDYFIKVYNQVMDEKNHIIANIKKTENLTKLKIKYHNEKLESYVNNTNKEERIIEYEHRLYRTFKPIYAESPFSLFKAHFYAASKPFFKKEIDTFWFNIGVIWFMSFILFIILYTKLLERAITTFETIRKRFKHRQEIKKDIIITAKETKKRKKHTKLKRFMKRFV